MSVRLFSLAPLLALGLWAITTTTATVTQVSSSVRSLAVCTDGVNCYCDDIANPASQWFVPNLLFCEDFEEAALNDGTGAGWTNKYGYGNSGSDADCTDDNYTREGTAEARDVCINIVTEAVGASGCDNYGANDGLDCVREGSQSLGLRYNPRAPYAPANTRNGIFGGGYKGTSWTPPTDGNFSVTMARKWSLNFEGPFGSANKSHEFSTNNGNELQCLLGCALNSCADFPYGYYNPILTSTEPGVTEPRACPTCLCGLSGGWQPFDGVGFLDFTPRTGRLSAATVNRGYAFQTTDAAVVDFGPMTNYQPDTTLGEWHCSQFHYSGWGTTNTRVRWWWDGVLIIDVTGVDTVNMNPSNKAFARFAWNNYFNDSYRGGTRAYQYQDMMTVSHGPEPVPCHYLGFPY